jgi:hypothetical protein
VNDIEFKKRLGEVLDEARRSGKRATELRKAVRELDAKGRTFDKLALFMAFQELSTWLFHLSPGRGNKEQAAVLLAHVEHLDRGTLKNNVTAGRKEWEKLSRGPLALLARIEPAKPRRDELLGKATLLWNSIISHQSRKKTKS